jgi:23S rRNA (adenine1618-N6)-methyltransferase
LVSSKDSLKPLFRLLKKAKVVEFKVVEMAQGQKTSRFIAWTYYRERQRSLSLGQVRNRPARRQSSAKWGDP